MFLSDFLPKSETKAFFVFDRTSEKMHASSHPQFLLYLRSQVSQLINRTGSATTPLKGCGPAVKLNLPSTPEIAFVGYKYLRRPPEIKLMYQYLIESCYNHILLNRFNWQLNSINSEVSTFDSRKNGGRKVASFRIFFLWLALFFTAN